MEGLFAPAQQAKTEPLPVPAPALVPHAGLVAYIEATFPLAISAPVLAEQLGVSAATVYERVRDGTIRRVSIGGKGSRVLNPRFELIRFPDGV